MSSSSMPHDRTDAYNASIFPVFWTYFPISVILLFILYSYPFTHIMCPPYFIPPQFWMVDCPRPSADLGFDFGGLPFSPVP